MNETVASAISTGIVEGIKFISEASLQQGTIWNYVFILLAILGVISILSAIFSKATQAVGIFIKMFVLIPAILILNLVNRKKRKERLAAWGELKKDLKKSNKTVSKKMWTFWFVVKILLPILVAIFLIWEWIL